MNARGTNKHHHGMLSPKANLWIYKHFKENSVRVGLLYRALSLLKALNLQMKAEVYLKGIIPQRPAAFGGVEAVYRAAQKDRVDINRQRIK